tara:strand:+ start:82 stop:315 length:234 start_codon:yes stop_codon:yes gene_type:complete
MKNTFFLLIGIVLGSCISWPGVILLENWKCFFNIVQRSSEEKISMKAALAVSPNFLLKGEKQNTLSKLRVVGDACFR